MDIKKVARKYREQNGNEKITNKELLWFMIAKFDELENRQSKTEMKVKMLMWGIPIGISITAIVVGLV